MSEVNQTIPSFVNGVSRQAVESRHESQVEDMQNCTLSFTDGTRRRNPLVHIGSLSDLNGLDPFIYSYVRGDGLEAYIIAVTSGAWYVYKLDGTLVTNSLPTPVPYLILTGGAVPRDSFSAITIGDTTVIVNKTKTVLESNMYTHGDNSSGVLHKKYAYYWVKRSYIAYGGIDNQSASTYQYRIKDGPASTDVALRPTDIEANAGSCSIDPDININEDLCISTSVGGVWTAYPVGANAYGKNSLTVANTLAGDLTSGTNPTTNSGSVLRQLKNNSGIWEVSDSWGNQASEGWWGYISKIQDLPEDMGEYEGTDTLIKITGDEKNNFEGFWATYTDGTWKESIASGIKVGLDNTTMPHTLVRNPQGLFTFAPFAYTDRKVGDDFSNMMPSFVGKTIEDVFFYRNRLGIISDDSIIMSELGIYENFFRTTVTDLLATDPIDVAVDTNRVVYLRYAVPFKSNLLLFGTNAQYILSSRDELKPDTATISQSTVYQMNPKTRPVPIGPNTYFSVNKGVSTQVREYFNVPDSVDNIAFDISAHISDYIPKNAIDMEVSAKYDMLFVLSSDDVSTIYVYNQSWEGDKKAQSAWHKWTFSSTIDITNIRCIGDELYIIYNIIEAGNNVTKLSKVSLAKSDYTSMSYVDAELTGNTTPYSSEIKLSEWGFRTGGDVKVDDKQGRLQIRSYQVQTRPSSVQKIKVDVGTRSHTSTTDKAVVMGETSKTTITVLSKDALGFCLDSSNLKGRFTTKSRTV